MSALKTNVLYCGDNLAILEEKILDESIDLIYLDPPFNTGRDHGAFEDTWHWTRESARTLI